MKMNFKLDLPENDVKLLLLYISDNIPGNLKNYDEDSIETLQNEVDKFLDDNKIITQFISDIMTEDIKKLRDELLEDDEFLGKKDYLNDLTPFGKYALDLIKNVFNHNSGKVVTKTEIEEETIEEEDLILILIAKYNEEKWYKDKGGESYLVKDYDEDNYILLMYISSQDRLLVCNDKNNSHYTKLLTLVLEEVGIESGITLEELFEYSKSLIFETKELILNK